MWGGERIPTFLESLEEGVLPLPFRSNSRNDGPQKQLLIWSPRPNLAETTGSDGNPLALGPSHPMIEELHSPII